MPDATYTWQSDRPSIRAVSPSEATSAPPPSRGFAAQVFSLAGLSYAAQGLTLLALPLITRLYAPEAWGVLAITIAALAVVTACASLRYQVGIALPEADADAARLLLLCLLLAAGCSGIVAIVLLPATLLGMFDALVARSDASTIAILFPLLTAAAAANTALSATLLRLRHSLVVGGARLLQVVTTLGCQLGLGWSGADEPVSLVIGLLAGTLVATGWLGQAAWRGLANVRAEVLRLPALRETAAAHAQLPRTLVRTDLLNSASRNALPILVAALFSTQLAGLLALANSLIGAPLSRLTSAVWQITHARLARHEPAQRHRFLASLQRLLCSLLAPPLVTLALFAEPLTALLGEDWQALSLLLAPIALMLYLNHVSNATSYFVAFGRFETEARVNLLLTAVPLIVLVAGATRLDGIDTIRLYCTVAGAFYVGVNLYWGLEAGRPLSYLAHLLGTPLATALAWGAGFAVYAMIAGTASSGLWLGVPLFVVVHAGLVWHRFRTLETL